MRIIEISAQTLNGSIVRCSGCWNKGEKYLLLTMWINFKDVKGMELYIVSLYIHANV